VRLLFFVVSLFALVGCGRIGYDALVVDCPPGWTPSPDQRACYIFETSSVGWDEAEAACEAAAPDAHLPVIESAEEYRFVSDEVAGGSVIWLGLTDRAEEGTMRWLTGAEPEFTMYPAAGIANGDVEDCIDALDEWNIWECSLGCPFVCELDGQAPDPTAY